MKINKIVPQVVDLYNPNGEKIGSVNQYEFNDFLIQIKNNYIEGYYALFNGEKINIIFDGRIDYQPDGFFDTIEKQLTILMGF